MWNITKCIQIQHGSEELWPGHVFWVCVHCDLDIREMTLGQDHDILAQKQIFACVDFDLDTGDMTLSEGHDMIVWYIILIYYQDQIWQ